VGSKRARGRSIKSTSPRADAYHYFRALTRGPGVHRIKKTKNLWEVRTPDGRRIRLRNPSESSSRNRTLDIRRAGGSSRDEIHYEFVGP
jgi:hypothetical protein